MIQRKKLGEIANISAGQGAPQGAENYSEEGTPFVKAGDLFYLVNGERECDIQKVSEEVAKNHRLKLYPKGTVLFAKSGMSCMKGYVYATNAECYVVSHLACIMPFDVDSKYLKYYFEYHKPNQLVKDASYPSISLADIAEMPINVFDDQTEAKIVDNLDAVNSLIAKSKEELGLLDNIVKSRFVEMFGEPVTNSKGYPIHQLSDHILFLTSGSRGWAQYYTDKGEWFITIKNVKDCRISVDDVQCINPPKNAEAERTRLREGDLLISITADLGRTGVVTKEIAEHGAYNNQHLTCIRLDRLALDPLYVAFFMESEAGKRQFEAKNMSAVKAGLNFDSIRSLRLIVPPLALQKEFTAFVSEVDKSKLSYEMEVAA